MKILVGISGGADSAYTAYKLKQMGHTVEGIVLEMHDHTDVLSAQKCADELGIKLHILDCRQDFKNYVISNFVSEYSLGHTPNPCTVCNRYVKIAKICEFARENGFDKAATGHYANIHYDENTNRYSVEMGADIKKDQSYMLWHLTQKQLKTLIFPLADITKAEIRNELLKTNMAYLAEAKESQEICFIPDKNYAKYIENIKGTFPEGNFIDSEGKVIGKHKGIIHYTIGQRKGLGISLGAPAYITKIDPQKNTVTVEKMSDVKGNTLKANSLNFQSVELEENKTYTFKVKIRYAAPPVEASVIVKDGVATVEFLQSVRAITPGQSAVFYDGNRIAFGGVII